MNIHGRKSRKKELFLSDFIIQLKMNSFPQNFKFINEFCVWSSKMFVWLSFRQITFFLSVIFHVFITFHAEKPYGLTWINIFGCLLCMIKPFRHNIFQSRKKNSMLSPMWYLVPITIYHWYSNHSLCKPKLKKKIVEKEENCCFTYPK